MILLQADIDEAVMIGKNGSYRLANELALELKYGGNIDCCLCKLKRLWLWTRTLSCMKELSSVAPIVTDTTNCLTQAQIKSLIGKIRATCSTT